MKRRILMVAACVLLIATMLIAPISASAASSNKVVAILKVTADGARLRQGPSSSYEVITSLKDGEKVFYLNKQVDAFCYVRTSKGKIGYMYKGFLKSYGAAYLNQIYYCSSKSAKVYKKASTKAKKITKLSKNQHVIVYEVRGSWAYIKTLGGTGGFVKTSALAKAK